MNKKLFFEAIIKFICGVLLVGALIFLSAGSFGFAKGWILMAVLFIPMFIAGLVMMAKSPELLKKRLEAKEKRGEQSLVIKLSGLMFICGFTAAGLDFRFGITPLPFWCTAAGTVIFILAYALYAEVLRENTYLSRTVEVQEGQKVIDTGLYGIVRHPMYSATLLLFISIPVILGSAIAVLFFLFYPFIIIKRLKDEEALLEKELLGYREYKNKVKFRLIPFIY